MYENILKLVFHIDKSYFRMFFLFCLFPLFCAFYNYRKTKGWDTAFGTYTVRINPRVSKI
jgi:hypothetical protein